MPRIERGGGIETVPLVGEATGAKGVSNGVTIFPPGGAIPLHTHNAEESVTVIEGEAVCEIEGRREVLHPYDTTYVPPGVPHRFINAGKGVMSIFWVYSSTRVSRTFVESGETVEHLSPEDRVG
jgi:quercetin dioxygenase-like cupin family protein